MKFVSYFSLLLAAVPALALPALEKRSSQHDSAPSPMRMSRRNPGDIDYNQDYNGDQVNYQYDLSTGQYSCNWNGDTDFVVGLGWSTGSARDINFSGSYSPDNSGSYYAVYGWINEPLQEYYVVESYDAYNPCGPSYVTQIGTLYSDGATYTVCTNLQENQPSIKGTATFTQYFSVRQDKRTSGTVTMANHINYWSQHGFGSDYAFQTFSVEAWSGSGSSSVSVS